MPKCNNKVRPSPKPGLGAQRLATVVYLVRGCNLFSMVVDADIVAPEGFLAQLVLSIDLDARFFGGYLCLANVVFRWWHFTICFLFFVGTLLVWFERWLFWSFFGTDVVSISVLKKGMIWRPQYMKKTVQTLLRRTETTPKLQPWNASVLARRQIVHCHPQQCRFSVVCCRLHEIHLPEVVGRTPNFEVCVVSMTPLESCKDQWISIPFALGKTLDIHPWPDHPPPLQPGNLLLNIPPLRNELGQIKVLPASINSTSEPPKNLFLIGFSSRDLSISLDL